MPNWKGLDSVLTEIIKETPGIRMEHIEPRIEPKESWESTEKKVMTIERWLGVVKKDILNAPSNRDRRIIVGPFYYWYRDDLGRALVMSNHYGQVVPLFAEIWAGEPD